MNKYNTSLKYGLYGALIGVVFFYLLLFSGNSPWGSASWMGSWIPGISAYYSVKTFIYFADDDSFKFSALFRISLITIFYQALFYNLLTVISSLFIQTNAIEIYKDELIQNAEQMKAMLSEQMYNQLILELQNLTHSTLAFWDFIYKLMGGTIVSLILASIFIKNKPIFEK
jgi:hypothetical protein